MILFRGQEETTNITFLIFSKKYHSFHLKCGNHIIKIHIHYSLTNHGKLKEIHDNKFREEITLPKQKSLLKTDM